MARPRVFVSSTYYDLKHLRSSLENFIEELGYEAVLSEKDNIAYMPDAPLDESCYREAKNSDIYVLIIGGRYGSEVSNDKEKPAKPKGFFERYESITKNEYISAIDRNIPAYILIDAAVDAEYQTYQRNKSNTKVQYAHVDSVNIFMLIEEIRERKQNNPIKLFSRYSEVEDWLREQWAGLFKELIHRLSTSQQIHDVDTKLGQLSETTETLKRYLEEVVSQVSKQKTDATEIIKQENARLQEAKRDAEMLSIGYMKHLSRHHNLSVSTIRKALSESKSYWEFIIAIFAKDDLPSCHASSRAFKETNEARKYLDLIPFDEGEFQILQAEFDKATSPKKQPGGKAKKAARTSKASKRDVH